jgi:2-(3-amino-3-carboxypropyl)histidine synthase
MKKYTLSDLKEQYDIDLNAIEKKIKKSKAKTVVLQFPDGLKPYSLAVKDYLQNKFPKITFTIWLGSCFGACDVPPVEGKADLVIQFGHSAWKKN